MTNAQRIRRMADELPPYLRGITLGILYASGESHALACLTAWYYQKPITVIQIYRKREVQR